MESLFHHFQNPTVDFSFLHGLRENFRFSPLRIEESIFLCFHFSSITLQKTNFFFPSCCLVFYPTALGIFFSFNPRGSAFTSPRHKLEIFPITLIFLSHFSLLIFILQKAQVATITTKKLFYEWKWDWFVRNDKNIDSQSLLLIILSIIITHFTVHPWEMPLISIIT